MARRLLLLAVVTAVVLASAAPVSASNRVVKAWTRTCHNPVCALIEKFVGAFNLGAFESIDSSSDSNQAERDLVVAVISSYGLPSAVVSYFKQYAEWDLPQQWNSTDLIPGLLQFPNVSLGVDQAAIGLAFQSIIEFIDTDNDGQYHPHIDTVVSTYSFLNWVKWRPMTLSTVSLDGGAMMYIFNLTTADNVFSLAYKITTSTGTTVDGAPLYNTGVKIDVRILNFPYRDGTGRSKLALSSFLVGESTSVDVAAGGRVNFGTQGFVDWTQQVSVGAGTAPLFASSLTDAVDADFLFSLLRVVLHTRAIMKRIYFSINATQPINVLWDPSVVYSGPLGPSGSSSPNTVGIAVGVSIACVAVIGGVAGFILYRRRKRNTSGNEINERTPLAA